MDILDNLGFETRCIHGGQRHETTTGAVMQPIFQTSTYAQSSPSVHLGYEYSRTHNPTRQALERSLANLEHAKHGFCFASGCAAATTLLLGLKAGDHVVAMDDLYGGTRRLFEKVFSQMGLSFTFCDLRDPSALDVALTDKTRLVFIETPTNPLLKLVDIAAVSQRAKARNVDVVVDNTFATPALQNPLLLGADLVLHSTTKYIGGHSDVLGGAILTNSDKWAEKLAYLSNAAGGVPAPWDCFLLLRGIKTLGIRMQRHCQNAQFLSEKLGVHPQVRSVIFPGLESFPQFELAKRQMKGPSGIISLELAGGEALARRVCEKTKLFTCAESLGGVESLIEHPASMTHASIDPATRDRLRITGGLIRLSVGIECAQDLWADLEQAMA
jgi:cystathionine gamma-lyase